VAQRRPVAEEMTPHEVKLPEEDFSLRRWFLMALQVLAMALCACILARMWVEYNFKLPHSMCVESPPPVERAPE
jgi:cell division septal protein FtsQ